MRLYKTSNQFTRTIDESKLEQGTKGFDFNIESVSAFKATEDKDAVLTMRLQCPTKGIEYNYRIFSNLNRREFLSDMNVEHPHDLHNKTITGYIHKNRIGLQAISAKNGVDLK
jgi:hypothetical protein